MDGEKNQHKTDGGISPTEDKHTDQDKSMDQSTPSISSEANDPAPGEYISSSETEAPTTDEQHIEVKHQAPDEQPVSAEEQISEEQPKSEEHIDPISDTQHDQQTAEPESTNQQPEPPINQVSEPKPKSNKILIIIICLLLVVVMVVGAILLFNKKPVPQVPSATKAATTKTVAAGEQLTKPPTKRPVQYIHKCVTGDQTIYISQGIPNCLQGDNYLGDYNASTPSSTYIYPCETQLGLIRYIYLDATGTCPFGTTSVK